MGINSEKDSFVYLKPEEDSNRYANIEIIENPFSEQDEFSDLGWKNYSSDSYQREALVSFGSERIEYGEYGDSFQNFDSEKFSKIFLEPNQEQSIDNHSCLYFAKQNPNINSKIVIPENTFSENSNIPNTMENSVLSGKVSKEYTLRKPCSLEDIRNILKKNKISQNIIEKVKDSSTDLDKQNVGYFVVKVKGTRQINTKKIPAIKELKLIGRKRKGDNKEGKHNKNDSDNIIKKCKAVLFKYIIIYVLDIVNKLRTNKEENFELLKLSYKKYIDKIKKKNELDLFKMKIKNLVSLETSSKYSINKDKDFNKKSINKILEEEKDNKVLINLLNMSFGDWIDIFTLKNNIENSFKFNGLEEALKDISDKNEEEYFSRFIFYLFNYQNYFYNKKGRRPKTKKNNKKTKLNIVRV